MGGAAPPQARGLAGETRDSGVGNRSARSRRSYGPLRRCDRYDTLPPVTARSSPGTSTPPNGFPPRVRGGLREGGAVAPGVRATPSHEGRTGSTARALRSSSGYPFAWVRGGRADRRRDPAAVAGYPSPEGRTSRAAATKKNSRPDPSWWDFCGEYMAARWRTTAARLARASSTAWLSRSSARPRTAGSSPTSVGTCSGRPVTGGCGRKPGRSRSCRARQLPH